MGQFEIGLGEHRVQLGFLALRHDVDAPVPYGLRAMVGLRAYLLQNEQIEPGERSTAATR